MYPTNSFPTNFPRDEFTFSQTAIRKGIDNHIPDELMPNALRLAYWLQTFRDRLKEKYNRDIPIIVSSGYRSPRLNKKIGGATNSDHMKALAADIIIPGFRPSKVFRLIRELMADCPYDQLIDEFSRWVHIGLAEDGDIPRMEHLLARKRITLMGKHKTVYTVA